ncbi:hypothetical protein HK405_000420 [Cladochytrium tenue]|nr:hypothetical protein HK405_000420 [Cladochytrium tenue]
MPTPPVGGGAGGAGGVSYSGVPLPDSVPLSRLLAADVIGAAATAASITPAVAIIDSSIIANMSGKTPLLAALKDGVVKFLTTPTKFVREPRVLAVFAVYSSTYVIANTTESFCLRNPLNNGTVINPALPKFLTSSAVNISMTLWKDQLLTRLYGIGPARRLPLISYFLFTCRDATTVAASFTFPPIIVDAASRRLRDASVSEREEQQRRAMLDIGVQLVLPCAVQWVTTPLHLMGLDLYNRDGAAAGTLRDRLGRVARGYVPSALARMGRILPAFGFGGVLNKWTRKKVAGLSD